MTLPAKITDINTATLGDFRSSFNGPFRGANVTTQDTGGGTNEFVLGVLAGQTERLGQSFQAPVSGPMVNFQAYMNKLNSPTDSILCELWSDNSGVPGTVLATSTAALGSTLTTPARYIRFVFPTPYSVTSGVTYHFVLRRTGAGSITNAYTVACSPSSAYANGTYEDYVSGAWTTDTKDIRFKFTIQLATLYQPVVDTVNNKIRMFKSVNAGNTWAEVDAANAVGISTTAGKKACASLVGDATIQVFSLDTSSQPLWITFNTATDLWTPQGSITDAVNTNVSTLAPMFCGYRGSAGGSPYILAFNGITETVMGTTRRRVCLQRGPVFASDAFDVAGSANSPPAATQPGTAVDYDVRGLIVDGNGDAHIFYTQSDTTSLKHRTYIATDAFKTINDMGSTPAVTSNTSKYPVGIGANYFKSGEWYIALPYHDTAAGSLKVARAKASIADIASNWTLTTASSSAPETALSNPCVLIADNEQGGKLYLFYVKSDRKIYVVNDGGNDMWTTEEQWRAGSTPSVGGIFGATLGSGALGIVYLDEAQTPDDLRFDGL